MRRIVVNVLAFVGAIYLFGTGVSWAIGRFADGGITGVVMGRGERPAAGAPIFLDRGHGVIERYVADSAGRFALPVDRRESARAVFLICAPGGMPFVIHPNAGQIGPTHYGYTEQPPGRPAIVRGFGWLGPMPRECPPALDSISWRYPVSAGKPTGAITTTEPDWSK